ncbi:MAG TPA: SDR family NAD(P)-dependent oxidoreductase [Anaerovoracaceae bacterium]|nr:SDR family NAD(P)-dependent oxidoreductase [Anaerovoracaceae bacterium]
MKDRRTAVVTGAGQGIGKAVALGLAEEGANVVVADINLNHAEETCGEARQWGVEAIPVKCDISDIADTEKMVADVVRRFGHIDILVNNAGISRNVLLEDMTESEWDQMMNVNLKGMFFLTRRAFLEMKKAGRGGKIVNVASIAGERGGLYAGMHYSASKAGVIVLTKCFAMQGGPHNITANAVSPGTVDTEITRRLKQKIDDVPMGRMATAEEVADAVVFLASDKASYINGVTLDINGGQYMR